MALYHKYRPTDFNGVKGNVAVVKSLKSAVSGEDKPHAFLLTGNRGVGKTTLARICAQKYLNTRTKNVFEMNFAEDGSVERARSLLADMKYAAIGGGNVVYVFEEFHRASTQAQETFLKSLEETPSHVYFFICTSKPNKVDAAVKSRCNIVHLKDLTKPTLVKLLTQVAIKEGIDEKVSDDVISSIVDNSVGSARVALTILDSVMRLDTEDEMFELISKPFVEDPGAYELFGALRGGKQWKDVAVILETLRKEDAESIRYAVLHIASNVLLKSNYKSLAIILECFSETLEHTGFPGLVKACYQVHNQN